MAIRDVLARIGGLEDKPSVGLWLPSEGPASPPMTTPERLASLDAEEALFRVWWCTLPDKNLARRRWRATLSWYHREKGFGPEMLEALEQRVQDLWETP